MSKPLTKPGKHGTLYRYAIAYHEGRDEYRSEWRCWAYDAGHACEQFDADDYYEGFVRCDGAVRVRA